MEEASSGPLFENVTFAAFPSEQLDDVFLRQLIDTVTTSGGNYVPLRDTDQEIADLESVSHIVATDIEFPQYARALELGVYVVKPSWISMSVMKRKRTAERQHSPDPAQFFKDVVVTCAGLPDGDQEAIFAGVMALGGSYSYAFSKLVTHIVTVDISHEMCVLAKQKKHPAKIVLPHWFHDCFRLGKKIGERPYTHPDPEILRADIDQIHVRAVPSPHLDGATTPSPTKMPLATPPISPSKSRKHLNAFMSKKVFLADDLGLSPDFVKAIEKLVNHGGGSITTDVDEANIYIGHYREGREYVAASWAGKEVANLSWLYHVINRNKYTSPLRKLFHYPLPPNGIKGFENLKISLSNYAGEARTYVENLIRYCGAEYTKTMKQDNTHLVTAHMHGEKCDAAREWGIEVINHLWLEESFAKCRMQPKSHSRYTAFPTRTNLGEVTGLTSLDMTSVERIYFPKARSPQKPTVHRMDAGKADRDSDTVTRDTAIEFSTDHDVPMTTEDAMDIADEEVEATAPKKPSRGRPSKSSLLATPRAEREKENDSPILTNSTGRASKVKALNTLHSQASDISLFQKEMKRKGGVVHGGRHSSAAEDAPSESPAAQRTSRKRPSDEYEVTALGNDLSDGETQAAAAKQNKKIKHGPTPALPAIRWRMMVTGDDRWSENPKKESADKITLRGLGILLTQDPKDIDILVAPRILRTRKFVSALACAPLVVDTSYLDHLLIKKKIMDSPPMLEDRDNEDKLGFRLAESLDRAELNKRKLFRGWDIFVTKDIHGGFDTYKDIIHLNGGVAMMYQGRNGVTVSKRTSVGPDDEGHVAYLVSSNNTEAETKLWKKFRDEMEKQNMEARIVTSDWVLSAAMSQKITLDDKWVLKS